MAVTIRNLPPGREFVKKTDFIAVAQTPGSPLTSKIALSAAVDAVVAAGAGLEIVEGELRVTNTLSSYEVAGFTGAVSGANGKFKPQSTTFRNGKMTYKNDDGWVQFWDGEKWILSDIPFTTEPPAQWISNGSEEKPGTFTFSPTGGSTGFAGQSGTNEVKSPPAVLTTELLSETGGLEIVDGKLQVEGTLPKTSVTGVTGELSGSNGTFTPNTKKIENGKPTYENENGWYQYWDKTLDRWVMTDTPYTVAHPAEWVANGTGEKPETFKPENGCSTGFNNQTISVDETPNGIIITTDHIGPESGLEFVDGKLRQIKIPSKIELDGYSGAVQGANGTYEIQEVKKGGKNTYKNENGWYKYWDETLDRWVLTDTPYTTQEPARWVGGGTDDAPGGFTTEVGTKVTGFTGTVSGASGNFTDTGTEINGKPTFQNENGWVQYWDPWKNRWILTDTPHTTNPPAKWIGGTNSELPGDFDDNLKGCKIGGFTGTGAGANGTFTPTGETENGKPVYKNENGWVQYWDPTTNRWVMTDTPYTTEAPAKWIGNGCSTEPGTFDSNNGGSTVTGFVGGVSTANGTFTPTGETENGKSTYSNGNGWFQYWDPSLNKWILTDKPYTTEDSNWVGNGSGDKPGTWDSTTGGGSPLFTGQSGGSSSLPGGGAHFSNQSSTTTSETGGSTDFGGQSSTTEQTGGGSADFGGNKKIEGLTGAAAGANGWFNVTGHKENGKATYTNQNGWVQYWDEDRGQWVMSNTPYTIQPPAMWVGNGNGDTPGEFNENTSGGSAEFQGQTPTTTTSEPVVPSSGESPGSPGSITTELPGQIPFYTGTSAPAVTGRSDFVVTSAGHVGIGTSEPGHQLTVSGDVSATGMIFADAFQSKDGNNTITFNDPVSVTGDITASGLTGTLTGDVIGDLTGALTTSLTVSGHQLNFYPTGNTAFPGFVEIINRDQNPTGIGFWPGGGAGDPKVVMSDTGTVSASKFHGIHTGLLQGPLTGDVIGSITGDLTGNVVGDVDGHLTGSVAGNSVGSWDIAGNALNIHPNNTATVARRAEIVNRGQSNDDGEGFAFYVSGGAGDPPIVFDKAGEITAQAFHGDGSQLTGLAEPDSISEGDTKVETIDTSSESKIIFDVDAASLMTIDPSGVTIGTEPLQGTARLLTITGAGSGHENSTAAIRLDNTTSGRTGLINFNDQQELNIWACGTSSNECIRFLTKGGSGQERMRITTDGRVGIGSDDPSTTLEVAGNLRINGGVDTGSQLVQWCDNNGHASIAAYDLFFKTGQNDSRTSSMFISHEGDVGISTTAPNATLHVSGDILADEMTSSNLTVTNKLELSSGSKILVPDISPTGAGVSTAFEVPKYDGQGTWVQLDAFGGMSRSTDQGQTWKRCKMEGFSGHGKQVYFAKLSTGAVRWYVEVNSSYPHRVGTENHYGLYSDDQGDTWHTGHSMAQGYYRGDSNNQPTTEDGRSRDGSSTFMPSHRAYSFNYSHAASNSASRNSFQNRSATSETLLPDLYASDLRQRQLRSWVLGGFLAFDSEVSGDDIFKQGSLKVIGGADYSFSDAELDNIEFYAPEWWQNDTSGLIFGDTNYYGYNVSYNYDQDFLMSYHSAWPAVNVPHGINIFIGGLRDIHRHKCAGGTIDQAFLDTQAALGKRPFILIHVGFSNAGAEGPGFNHGKSYRNNVKIATRNIACDSIFTMDGYFYPTAALAPGASLADFYEDWIRYAPTNTNRTKLLVTAGGGQHDQLFNDEKVFNYFFHSPTSNDKIRMLTSTDNVRGKWKILEMDGAAAAAAMNNNSGPDFNNSVTEILNDITVDGTSEDASYDMITNTDIKNRLVFSSFNDTNQIFVGSLGAAARRDLTKTSYDNIVNVYPTANANGMSAPSFYTGIYNPIKQVLDGKFAATFNINSQPPRALDSTGAWTTSNLPSIMRDYKFSIINGTHKHTDDPLNVFRSVYTGSRWHHFYVKSDGRYGLTRIDAKTDDGASAGATGTSATMNSDGIKNNIHRNYPGYGGVYGYSRGESAFVEAANGDTIWITYMISRYSQKITMQNEYIDIRRHRMSSTNPPTIDYSTNTMEQTQLLQSGIPSGIYRGCHVYWWGPTGERQDVTQNVSFWGTGTYMFYTKDTQRTAYDQTMTTYDTTFAGSGVVARYPHYEWSTNVPFPADQSSRVVGRYYEGDTLIQIVQSAPSGVTYSSTNMRWEVWNSFDNGTDKTNFGTVQSLGGTVTEISTNVWRIELPIPRITNTLHTSWNGNSPSFPGGNNYHKLDSHSGEYQNTFWLKGVNVSDPTDTASNQFDVRSGAVGDWADEPSAEDMQPCPFSIDRRGDGYNSDLVAGDPIWASNYTTADGWWCNQFPSGRIIISELGRNGSTDYSGPQEYLQINNSEFDLPFDSRTGTSPNTLKYRMRNRVGPWNRSNVKTPSINGTNEMVMFNWTYGVYFGDSNYLTLMRNRPTSSGKYDTFILTNDEGDSWATISNPTNTIHCHLRYHRNNDTLYCISPNGEVFYINGNTLRTTTPDATDVMQLSWNQLTIAGLSQVKDLVYHMALDLYFALGDSGFYMTSSDGLTNWISELTPQYAFATSLLTGLYKDVSHNLHLLNDGESKLEIKQNSVLIKDVTKVPKLVSPLRIEDTEGSPSDGELFLGQNVRMTATYDGGDGGELKIYNWQNSNWEERLTIADDGAVHISGVLSKSSGTFKIDHPLDSMKKTHHLVHSFLEGPRADLIYRGQVTLQDGSAEADIDAESDMTTGTFEKLCRNVQCFTNNETSFDAVKGEVIGNKIIVESENTESTATVSWMVIAERKDDHMLRGGHTDETGRLITELEKDLPEDPSEKSASESEDFELTEENIQIFDESVDPDILD